MVTIRQSFQIHRGKAFDSGGASGTCSTVVQTMVMMMRILEFVVGVWWVGTKVG
jgi:hypothetical protein